MRTDYVRREKPASYDQSLPKQANTRMTLELTQAHSITTKLTNSVAWDRVQ